MKSQENSNANLNNIIQKIKTEGIQEAEKKSEEIIKEAELSASKIIDQARQDAGTIIEDAEAEIRKKESISKTALEQAARDIILSIRSAIIEILDSLIKNEYKKTLSVETLETILLKIIEGWNKDKGEGLNLELILSESDKSALTEGFMSKLKDQLGTGMELKAHPDIEKGFRISLKDNHIYYDFTDESIAEVLAEYLNPKFHDFLDSLKT